MFLSGIFHTAFFWPDVVSMFFLAVCVKAAEVEWRESFVPSLIRQQRW